MKPIPWAAVAWADFLQRTRSPRFGGLLALMLILGFQVGVGNLRLQLGSYRGLSNSAWLGASITLVTTVFLGWLGFFSVRGSVTQDRQTGMAGLLAATPLEKGSYVVGKAMSSFAALMVMAAVLFFTQGVIQGFFGEDRTLSLGDYFWPLCLVVGPVLAFVAASALLFEVVRPLSGGLGGGLWFFGFALLLSWGTGFLGIDLIKAQMQGAVLGAYPDYDGRLLLGGLDSPAQGVFCWQGIRWTPRRILERLVWFLPSLGLLVVAGLAFSRFDEPRPTVNPSPRPLAPEAPLVGGSAWESRNLAAPRPGWPLGSLVAGELRLGSRAAWWWCVLAVLEVALWLVPPSLSRQVVVPLCLLWPGLLWSALGNRERSARTHGLVFSSSESPLLPLAQVLAGLVLGLVAVASGVVQAGSSGDGLRVMTLVAAAFMAPALAVVLGVITGSKTAFEGVYLTLWYLGAVNHVPGLDFLDSSRPQTFWWSLGAAILFTLLALVVRRWQRAWGH